jgi:cytochrome c oxidase subunit 2
MRSGPERVSAWARRAATPLLLVPTGLARADGIGLPRDVSLDGHRIDSLIHVTIVFTGLLFVVMVGWMVIAVIRGRKGPAAYDRGDSRKAVLGVLGFCGAVFVVVDGNLLGHALVDLNQHFWAFDRAEQTPGSVRVEVNAHQWAWNFRYAGPDGKFNTEDDVVTLNDLRIPVGAPVILQLASTDVVHSIYLPNFRVKQDAIPGMFTRLWFQAQEAGEFEIGCAQHCGPNHYKMRATLTALPRADFDAWAATASADGRRAWDPDDPGAHWGWEWRPER